MTHLPNRFRHQGRVVRLVREFFLVRCQQVWNYTRSASKSHGRILFDTCVGQNSQPAVRGLEQCSDIAPMATFHSDRSPTIPYGKLKQ